MSTTESTVTLAISSSLFIICWTFVVLSNILLIKPVLKREKNISLKTILSLFLLFSVIISCCVLMMRFLIILGFRINCDLFYLLNPFYIIPVELSTLNMMINSFFMLTNNHFFLLKKKLAIIMFTVITWVPPLLFSLLLVLTVNFFFSNCSLSSPSYNFYYTFFVLFIDAISCITCIIMLIFLCRMNVDNHELLKISKKKSIFQKVSLLIGIIIFCLVKVVGSIIYIFTLYLNALFCLVFFAFELIFLWDQHLKKAILIIYCCKTNEEIYNLIDECDTNELMQCKKDNEENSNY